MPTKKTVTKSPSKTTAKKKTFANLNEVHKAYQKQLYDMCMKAKPSDFYFHVTKEGGRNDFTEETIVFITPRVFFDKNGTVYNSFFLVDHILPDHYIDYDLGAFITPEDSIEEAIEDMKALGFKESEKYSALIEQVTTSYRDKENYKHDMILQNHGVECNHDESEIDSTLLN